MTYDIVRYNPDSTFHSVLVGNIPTLTAARIIASSRSFHNPLWNIALEDHSPTNTYPTSTPEVWRGGRMLFTSRK